MTNVAAVPGLRRIIRFAHAAPRPGHARDNVVRRGESVTSPCPGRGAARSDALQTRDRSDLNVATIPERAAQQLRPAVPRTQYRTMGRYFVYILANTRRGVMYVGVTSDLGRRIEQHRAKAVPAFTRTYGLAKLVYVETYASLDDARARERALKRWRREWKFKLIEAENPDWRDLSDTI
ncbi:MAG TPA: GIY-YIG nuclease family protein [Pseudolabrys sp.]|nr:GIY-YIG nuclease family protein [Pseudolabrys sp.]